MKWIQIKVITFHVTSSLFYQRKSLVRFYFVYLVRFANGGGRHDNVTGELFASVNRWNTNRGSRNILKVAELRHGEECRVQSRKLLEYCGKFFLSRRHVENCSDNKKGNKPWQRMQLSLWQTFEAFVTCYGCIATHANCLTISEYGEEIFARSQTPTMYVQQTSASESQKACRNDEAGESESKKLFSFQITFLCCFAESFRLMLRAFSEIYRFYNCVHIGFWSLNLRTRNKELYSLCFKFNAKYRLNFSLERIRWKLRQKLKQFNCANRLSQYDAFKLSVNFHHLFIDMCHPLTKAFNVQCI